MVVIYFLSWLLTGTDGNHCMYSAIICMAMSAAAGPDTTMIGTLLPLIVIDGYSIPFMYIYYNFALICGFILAYFVVLHGFDKFFPPLDYQIFKCCKQTNCACPIGQAY